MEEQKYKNGHAIEISLEDIVTDGQQPRRHFNSEAVLALAKSIENEGLVQSIVVRPFKKGKFTIVSGERRYRAYQELSRKSPNGKWDKIPAIVRDVDGPSARNIALLENILKEDLIPIERAEALLEYKERNGIRKDKELADTVGLSVASISNILKLNCLIPQIKDEVRKSKDYSLRELIRIAHKEKAEDQLEMFNALKKRIRKGRTRRTAVPTEEKRTLKRIHKLLEMLFKIEGIPVASLDKEQSLKSVESALDQMLKAVSCRRQKIDFYS